MARRDAKRAINQEKISKELPGKSLKHGKTSRIITQNASTISEEQRGLEWMATAGFHPPIRASGCFEEYIFFKMEIYFSLCGEAHVTLRDFTRAEKASLRKTRHTEPCAGGSGHKRRVFVRCFLFGLGLLLPPATPPQAAPQPPSLEQSTAAYRLAIHKSPALEGSSG